MERGKESRLHQTIVYVFILAFEFQMKLTTLELEKKPWTLKADDDHNSTWVNIVSSLGLP